MILNEQRDVTAKARRAYYLLRKIPDSWIKLITSVSPRRVRRITIDQVKRVNIHLVEWVEGLVGSE